MLAEMGRFLQVHRGRSARATSAEALYRATLAPAEILGLDRDVGRLEAGRPMSFIEVEPASRVRSGDSADAVVRSLIPADLDAPAESICRVTVGGRTVFPQEFRT
jgi:cytosine/adenosine deaminase-related metal-dependent hydrolase